MINNVVIIGKIVSDLIKRETSNGSPYVKFTVQTTNDFNKKTTDIPVVAWNENAKKLFNSKGYGDCVVVRGSIVQYKAYKSSTFNVSADSIKFFNGEQQIQDTPSLQQAVEEKNEVKAEARTRAFLDAQNDWLNGEG